MNDIWYHWSPVERRASIIKHGLLPGKFSTDKLWRPPYICLATSPSLAWGLSGGIRKRERRDWDLWQADVSEQSGYEELYFDGSNEIKEIRVYERIYKRNVWYVATRNVRV